ncbi:MAG: hypothetical protein GX666_08230 [Tissierellia bacterium]|jgi:hypothetical protein|nr:hypothetical protein [Tissierellia bacterium]
MENKKQLILDVINNKEADRVPVGFWWHFADEYNQFRGLYDEDIILNTINGTKKLYDELHPDFVKIMSDAFFGHPSIMENDIESIEDIKKIKSIGENHEWYDKQVAMVKEINNYFNGEILAFYNIFAPLNYIRLYTECYKQKPELFVELFLEDPEAMLNASMEIAKDLIVLVKKLKEESGISGTYYSVQALQSDSEGKEFHEKYVKPSDMEVLKIIDELWENNILHICGYADYTNNLNFYVDYPAKVYNWAVFTEKVSLKEGKELFKGSCVLGGFDNNKETLIDKGSEEEIEEHVKNLIEDSGNKGVIIGADCTVSPEIGYRRLDQIRELAKKYS